MIRAGLAAAVVAILAGCSGEAAQDAVSTADASAVIETASATVPDPVVDHHAAGTAAGMSADENVVPGSGEDGHGIHYEAPPLETLGGAFSMTEASTGKTFTDKDLLGTWSLVYLGYMECLEACPIALKSMPAAIADLQAAGIPAKAVFIDINAPRLDDMTGAMGHGAAHDSGATGAAAGGHGGHDGGPLTGPEVRRRAIAEWAKIYDPSIIMLSGSRKQLQQAKRIFQTRVEQTMMPTKEVIHHLNHTTMIYIMNPKGNVAGLLYHSDPSAAMAQTVKELAKPGSTPT